MILKKFLPFILLLSINLLSDCKKKPFNYRNKYTGTWHFTFTLTECGKGPPKPCSTATSEYDGKIYYGGGKNNINIEYSPGGKSLFMVDKNGILSGCGVTGSFENSDHVSFVRDFYQECTGALGSSSSYTVTGTRK